MGADFRGGLITWTHLTDVKVPPQTSAFPAELLSGKAMFERDFYSHRPTGDMCSCKLFSGGYFLVWLEFFDGTIRIAADTTTEWS